MPRQVEGNDAKCFRELVVCQQMPPLPSVGACGVQAHQRYARAAFLEIDAMHLTIDLDMDITADHRLDMAGHVGTAERLSRGSASTSLKYCRCAMNGCRSPSSVACSRLVKASRSCQPGRGTGFQYSAQAAADARYENRQDRIKTGAGVKSTMLPPRIDTSNGWS